MAELIANVLFILNVNGLNSSIKWQWLTEWIKKKYDPTLYFLQGLISSTMT